MSINYKNPTKKKPFGARIKGYLNEIVKRSKVNLSKISSNLGHRASNLAHRLLCQPHIRLQVTPDEFYGV